MPMMNEEEAKRLIRKGWVELNALTEEEEEAIRNEAVVETTLDILWRVAGLPGRAPTKRKDIVAGLGQGAAKPNSMSQKRAILLISKGWGVGEALTEMELDEIGVVTAPGEEGLDALWRIAGFSTELMRAYVGSGYANSDQILAACREALEHIE